MRRRLLEDQPVRPERPSVSALLDQEPRRRVDRYELPRFAFSCDNPKVATRPKTRDLGAVIEEQLLVLERCRGSVLQLLRTPNLAVATRDCCFDLDIHLASVIGILRAQVRRPNRKILVAFVGVALTGLAAIPIGALERLGGDVGHSVTCAVADSRLAIEAVRNACKERTDIVTIFQAMVFGPPTEDEIRTGLSRMGVSLEDREFPDHYPVILWVRVPQGDSLTVEPLLLSLGFDSVGQEIASDLVVSAVWLETTEPADADAAS